MLFPFNNRHVAMGWGRGYHNQVTHVAIRGFCQSETGKVSVLDSQSQALFNLEVTGQSQACM